MAPDSTLAFTRSLLRLRRDEPALRHGRAEALNLPAPLIGFTREAAGRRITVLFNLSDEAVPLPPEFGKKRCAIQLDRANPSGVRRRAASG